MLHITWGEWIEHRVPLQPALRGVEKAFQNTTAVADALLNPVCLSFAVVGLWRLGQDLDVTRDFPIERGLFSHWQFWILLAIAVKAAQGFVRRTPSNVE